MPLYIEYPLKNNKSNFVRRFTNSSDISVMNISCLELIHNLNRLFGMFTHCSNTGSKPVAKLYDCLNLTNNRQVTLKSFEMDVIAIALFSTEPTSK